MEMPVPQKPIGEAFLTILSQLLHSTMPKKREHSTRKVCTAMHPSFNLCAPVRACPLLPCTHNVTLHMLQASDDTMVWESVLEGRGHGGATIVTWHPWGAIICVRPRPAGNIALLGYFFELSIVTRWH